MSTPTEGTAEALSWEYPSWQGLENLLGLPEKNILNESMKKILDIHNVYKINIQAIDESHDRSMRELYGLKPEESQ